jgi:hypothetical protein
MEHDLFRKPVSTFRDHALVDPIFLVRLAAPAGFFFVFFCIEFSPTQLVSPPLGAGLLAGHSASKTRVTALMAAPSALAMICI